MLVLINTLGGLVLIIAICLGPAGLIVFMGSSVTLRTCKESQRSLNLAMHFVRWGLAMCATSLLMFCAIFAVMLWGKWIPLTLFYTFSGIVLFFGARAYRQMEKIAKLIK